MRRVFWLVSSLALLAAGLYLAGRPPSAYVLEKECERLHEERQRRYTHLSFQIARAEEEARPDLRRQMDAFLRETRTIGIRGWDIVLVPAGARAPGQDYRVAHRHDPSAPADPPQLKGPMEAWTRPAGFLARAFAWR